MFLNRFVVTAALCTVALSAQNYRGKVTLPVETHWGVYDLQPGEYTISADTLSPLPVVHVTGNGISAFIVAMVRPAEPGKGGQLELSEVNGNLAVTKLNASVSGKEFSFAVPKSLSKTGLGAVALKKAVLPIN